MHSWDDWLRESWQRIARRRVSGPVLLSEVQTLAWWESVIADAEGNTATSALLDVTATARAARSAWRLVRGWMLSLTEINPAGNADAAAFLKWAREVEQGYRERHWIDADGLAGALLDLLARGDWQPGPVLFFGFDSLAPIQQRVASAVGARILGHEHRRQLSARRIACGDGMREIRHAARRSAQLAADGPEKTIGIVVPDLFTIRDDIDRELAQACHFDPDPCQPEDVSLPYRISTGRPLSAYPVIDGALLILRFLRGLPSSGALSRLLRLPFCKGGTTEFTARSLMDEQLRRRGIADVTPRGLLAWLNRGGARMAQSCPLLKEILQEATALSIPGRQPPAGWAHSFSAWLRAFGWPGERALDGAEYQTVGAWNDLLGDFASLSLLAGEPDRRAALDKLAVMARHRLYQPQAQPTTIHVITPAESAGMQFDHLWIMGMSEAQWPPAAQPSPFLPVGLQRRLGMPGADPHEVLVHARHVRDRWLTSAEHLVVSYPTSHDEQPAAVSALFCELVEVTVEALGLAGLTYAEKMSRRSPPLEARSDPIGPPLAERRPARGGAGVFRDQAACPFRAFARYRLAARQIDEVEPGLDAAQRGNLVHRCLTEMWRRLHSHAGLGALDVEALRAELEQAVDTVIARLPRRGAKRFHVALMALERERLSALLAEWAERERVRAEFVVFKCEHEIVPSIGTLPVRMRIDRIDRLADGSLFVIDYKTGASQKPRQWFGPRPDDPQLPAYVIGLDESVSAIAFAQVNRNACRWTGLCRTGSPAPGVCAVDVAAIDKVATWTEAVAAWREVLLRLAADFQRGDARVAPKQADTCRNCEVGPLCRIAEQRQHHAQPDQATDAE